MTSIAVRVGLAISLLCVCLSAAAGDRRLDWTYVGALYQSGDIESAGDLEFDGYRIEGSLGLGSWLHVKGAWEQLLLDDADDGMGGTFSVPDLDVYSLGGGIHTPESPIRFGESESLVPKDPSYYSFFLDGEFIKADGAGADRNGFAVDVGLRAANNTRWEVYGAIGYEKFENTNGEITLNGQVLFDLFRFLQLQGGIDWNEEIIRYQAGLRVPFR